MLQATRVPTAMFTPGVYGFDSTPSFRRGGSLGCLVEPGSKIDVDEIHAARNNLDEGFAVLGLRIPASPPSFRFSAPPIGSATRAFVDKISGRGIHQTFPVL